ncbi:MAG: hypothetical protein IT337_15245 [Thermomicrobiales bacterium]|nr:hypothetical protein [Thermomicrobiales bacterium]
MLSACASQPAREPLTRQLPAEPGFARPVAVPDPRAGESAILVAQRERQGRKRANAVIDQFRRWYRGVRQSYGAKE